MFPQYKIITDKQLGCRDLPRHPGMRNLVPFLVDMNLRSIHRVNKPEWREGRTMHTLGVAAVPKVITCPICRPEDPVPNDGNEDRCGPNRIENVVHGREISRSRCVREGRSEKVSDR